MRRTIWAPVAVVLLAGVAVTGVVAARSGGERTTRAAHETPAATAKVTRGALSAMVARSGVLTYRARPDGTPYPVINRADGVYTTLPETGDKVGCGGVLYRVDGRPVVLLCGTVPAYRDLDTGAKGADVRQLNRNLHDLGYDTDPGARTFTARTRAALKKFQDDKGQKVTGELALSDAVFLPEPMRIAEVGGQLGGSARPGTTVLKATSDRLQVQVALDPSQQDDVAEGDRATIVLPGNRPVPGKVDGFGRVATQPESPDSRPVDATVPTYISLDDPAAARELDRAPVQVEITTTGVENALSVPVTALVGSGEGFAVEVVRAGGSRELVTVKPGLFDSSSGRVQVEGDVREGDAVVVPSA